MKLGICSSFVQGVSDPAQQKWYSPVAFTPKKWHSPNLLGLYEDQSNYQSQSGRDRKIPTFVSHCRQLHCIGMSSDLDMHQVPCNAQWTPSFEESKGSPLWCMCTTSSNHGEPKISTEALATWLNATYKEWFYDQIGNM